MMGIEVMLSSPEINQDDIDAVVEVLKSGHLSLGPKLEEFEGLMAEYVGKKRAVAVNSGTSAMYLGMKAMGIGPGDEVITTPFTFIASVNTIIMTGAKPVFAEIDNKSMNIDPACIEDKITDKTKAILPVEVFGNADGFDEIVDIARKHNLLVIEDSCEALGTIYKDRKAGTFGDVSFFAFYPNKQMTTGEGGMVLTDDEEAADLCVSWRNQGRGKGGGWLAHQRLGYNYRMSDINCALGISQLKRIEQFVVKRRAVANHYQKLLKDEKRLIVPSEPEDGRMSWFVFVVRVADEDITIEKRNEILQKMHERGVQVSNYFPPVYLQPFIADELGHKPGDFPVTDAVCKSTIALPFHNNVSKDDAGYVVEKLGEVLDEIL